MSTMKLYIDFNKDSRRKINQISMNMIQVRFPILAIILYRNMYYSIDDLFIVTF